jgi:hypothetical protein
MIRLGIKKFILRKALDVHDYNVKDHHNIFENLFELFELNRRNLIRDDCVD